MIPPFNTHPLVRQYNDIKKYFRKYETDLSRERIHEFREYARLIDLANMHVAFDITGSLNFGMTVDQSDVDVVLYVHCDDHGLTECTRDNCGKFRDIETQILQTLIRAYAARRHDLQIIDCVNLTLLGHELDRGNAEADIVLRFAFYRSICRSINAALLRPYHLKLQNNSQLVEDLKPHLFAVFDGLCNSSQHRLSMRKYQERLRAMDVAIPDSILTQIRNHLDDFADYDRNEEVLGRLHE
ncbi:MAG: hypothetical protein KDK30_03995 [Leptospiraceae bacterium]|nr:hypothetical protein [Leptospiraceae bacterium]MCB1316104.1 hypothetical protein [Leptospiraceae bacterium]MCB1323425.1 hypothetical protein [Leptospiraceae bacterium]